MLTTRKAWWATVLLAAFTGCTGEEPAGENTPAAPATPSPEAKATDGSEPAKPDAPKEEAPKADAPKEDAPKIEGPASTPAKPEAAPDAKKEAAAAPEKEELSADEIANIEKLPAEDKAVAIKQIVCPVSGEHLGSMGTPLKTSAEGKSFMLCCKGCLDDVKSDPKAVIAKLNQK